jgi:hypothetical protein
MDRNQDVKPSSAAQRTKPEKNQTAERPLSCAQHPSMYLITALNMGMPPFWQTPH